VINLKITTYTEHNVTFFTYKFSYSQIFFVNVIQTISFFVLLDDFYLFHYKKEKCLIVIRRKGLDNRGLLITDLYFKLCFSMILSIIYCNPQSENNEFKRSVILPEQNLPKVVSFSLTSRVIFPFRNALFPPDNQISSSKKSMKAGWISVAAFCNSKKN